METAVPGFCEPRGHGSRIAGSGQQFPAAASFAGLPAIA